MKTLKVIIVESDQRVIAALKKFELENSMILSILDIAESLDGIKDLIHENKPDVLMVSFDNINFDEGVLEGLRVHKPKLLCISKDEADAYRAFNNNAIHFIRKPIEVNALIIAIYKALKYIEMETVFMNFSINKIKLMNSNQNELNYISIHSLDRVELVKLDDIIYCEADGKYTVFFTSDNKKLVSSKNLGEHEKSFNNSFFRIHHSYLININYLEKIKKDNGLFCEMKNGLSLPVAKRRQEEFMKYINK